MEAITVGRSSHSLSSELLLFKAVISLSYQNALDYSDVTTTIANADG
jgi:hypothetical protein